MSSLVGKTILDRYFVQEFIGRGGMAEVYKVWDKQRMTLLAMKVLLEDLALDRVFVRRFKREANTLESLQHPNIVRFFGFEKENHVAFMLMDYIEGQSLKRFIHDADGDSMPYAQIRDAMRSVCGALNYAHSQGLVHCDIKPANIMVDMQGNVRLADFGIARMSDAATATMVGAGTPAYMAPEQVRGEDPVPQTDVYALGVVLYEMFTGGERPFTGDQAQTTGGTGERVRWEQLHLAPPSPKVWNPSLSDKVEAVILKCLDKDPAKRYQTALELVNALELALGQGLKKVPFVVPVREPGYDTAENRPPQPKGKGQQENKQKKKMAGLIPVGIGLLVVFAVFACFVLFGGGWILARNLGSVGESSSRTVDAPDSESASSASSVTGADEEEQGKSPTPFYTATNILTNTAIPTDTVAPTSTFTLTPRPEPTSTTRPIISLKTCNISSANICLNSFGEMGGELMLTLKVYYNVSNLYIRFTNGNTYPCKKLSGYADRYYCLGPMVGINEKVTMKVYGFSNEQLAQGSFIIPSLAPAPAPSNKPKDKKYD